MGDGSAVMQSLMMLRGTGNGHQAAEGLPAVDGSTALLDSALQQLEKRFSAGTMGAGSNGWGQASVQNGVFIQPNNSGAIDHMDSQQQHTALLQQDQVDLQQQQQQFEFAQAMQQQYQQQVSHMQALLGAQMAQLHGSVEQQAAVQQQLQQQQALQLAKAAAAAAAPAAAEVQRQRLSKDGSWFNTPGTNHQQQQQQQQGQVQQQQHPPQHHQQQLQGAVSALRQSLLQQQQQQLQRRQSLEQQQQYSLGQESQLATKPLVFKVGTPGQPGAHMVYAKAGSSSMLASSAPVSSSSKQPPYLAAQQQQHQQQLYASDANAHTSSVSPPSGSTNTNSSSCRFSANGPPSSNLTVRMTIQLVATYKKCTPPGPGAGVPQPLPRRVLTKPGAAVKNDGWDNEASDLVLCTQVSSSNSSSSSKQQQQWQQRHQGEA
jgi:hypothetical protein